MNPFIIIGGILMLCAVFSDKIDSDDSQLIFLIGMILLLMGF